MPARAALIGVTALSGLLALAAPAATEGPWVLWEESADIRAFQRIARSFPKSGHATLADCVAAIDAEWQAALDATDGPERHSFSRATPTSALTITRNARTKVTYIITYTCLPDSIRPPEPKGK
jgi:hypothetical protein